MDMNPGMSKTEALDQVRSKPMFSEGGRVKAQGGLFAGQMPGRNPGMNPMGMNQGLGAPNLGSRSMGMTPGMGQPMDPRMAQMMQGQRGPTRAVPKESEDTELIQLIKMLTALGIPMEQLRGRTKEELVEMLVAVSGKGKGGTEIIEGEAIEERNGEEEVIEEEVVEAAQGGRIGYANGGIDDWYREYIAKRNERGAKYNPSRSEYERHVSRPIPLGGTMPEGGLDEMRRQRREQGPAFFAIPTAQDGRIGAQEGGLMDLGGMEKDYRDDGGFVPLGGEEKADDVPARLSKNEFVFTADAVRNAGGGDIDRGAEVMENVMKNLEAGGKVSEESQGQGAEEMFEVSERLSEVV